ncbi:hypothetical protein BCV70DRAFT_22878 [Testicularia cyperi]|uniref:Uncharacterized protein n=1 Tax=Testicularia cyperi TaxID=1882483 RepID=A0A317Y063_9BASI|nr:hypothetical protein BCV70DRAFT_22878 [Testicularia cyperi]
MRRRAVYPSPSRLGSKLICPESDEWPSLSLVRSFTQPCRHSVHCEQSCTNQILAAVSFSFFFFFSQQWRAFPLKRGELQPQMLER